MLHISATVDSPSTFCVDLRTLLKCPLPFGCSAEGFGRNQWYLQALDEQGLYQQGWKGTFAHTSYAETYWPLSPEAHEWKKKIQNLKMGHDDRGNPYLEFIYTGNKVGEELVYAVPSGWGMAVYPIFICTYPVEHLKPAVIEVIYSKKGQGPLVGIAPVIEEKRPSRVEKEWSFQDESLNHSHPFETNVWYKYVAQAARQAKHSDCFVCSHMPHSTSQPIAYATPINITSAKCAFNVSLLNASTVQCTHTPLFKPGKGKPPGLKMKTQHHHFQRCLGQDQPKLDPVI